MTSPMISIELFIQILMILGVVVGCYFGIKIAMAKVELKIENEREKNMLDLNSTKKEFDLKIEAQRKEFDIKLCGYRNEFEIMIKSVEQKNTTFSDFLGERVTSFITDNKDDHIELKSTLGLLTTHVNKLTIDISQIPKK